MAARRGPGPVAVLALLALLGPGWPLRGARAALNLQELSELKYGLEILAEPVLAGQVRRGTGANGRVGGGGGPYRDRLTGHGTAEEGGTGCGSGMPLGGCCGDREHLSGDVRGRGSGQGLYRARGTGPCSLSGLFPGPGAAPGGLLGSRTGLGGSRGSRSGREQRQRHRARVRDRPGAGDTGLGLGTRAREGTLAGSHRIWGWDTGVGSTGRSVPVPLSCSAGTPRPGVPGAPGGPGGDSDPRPPPRSSWGRAAAAARCSCAPLPGYGSGGGGEGTGLSLRLSISRYWRGGDAAGAAAAVLSLGFPRNPSSRGAGAELPRHP